MFIAGLGYDPARRQPGELGIEDVTVFEAVPPAGQPRTWVAHTVGLRDIMGNQLHLIAFYQMAGADAVAEVARASLTQPPAAEGGTPGLVPDYLGPNSVRQLAIEPRGLWVGIEAGVGAHGGVFELFRFADNSLRLELAASNSSPGVASSADIDGDGALELLVDAGEAYVFCYACGVRIPAVALWRWDGAQLREVTLERLPAGAPAELSERNELMLAYARAGLWADVRRALGDLDALLEAGDLAAPEALRWNMALLRINEEAKRARLELPEPAYALLDRIFYGDYAGAVALFRPYAPEVMFAPASPLVAGTVAEGWEESLAGWAERSASAALAVMPELAPAHFVQGWAAWLVGNRAGALAAMEQAAALDPAEPLYAAALPLLRAQAAAGGAFAAPPELDVRTGPGDGWPALAVPATGAPLTATGRLETGEWLQLLLPQAGETQTVGWVATAATGLAPDAVAALPVVPAPALVAPVVERGRIFYSQVNDDGIATIWSVDVVAGAHPLPVVNDGRQPALQPQGQLLAFTSTRPDMLGIGGLDLRTGERLRFTFNVEDALPRWLVSGDRLLFSSTREGDRRPRIYQVWADGAGSSETIALGRDGDIRIQDGQVVFKGCDAAGGACGLWAVAPDGSNPAPLTDNPGDARARWSPDGSTLVFMSDQRDGNWEIYLLTTADGQVQRLTTHPGADGLPDFSPNGGSVAWVGEREDGWHLFTLPLSAGGEPLPDATTLLRLGERYPAWLDQGLDWAP
jgi:hypothetical protein